MAQILLVLSVLFALVAGWYSKAWYDYTKTEQEDIAMGFELKSYNKYLLPALLTLVLAIVSLTVGLALL